MSGTGENHPKFNVLQNEEEETSQLLCLFNLNYVLQINFN